VKLLTLNTAQPESFLKGYGIPFNIIISLYLKPHRIVIKKFTNHASKNNTSSFENSEVHAINGVGVSRSLCPCT
jgi:hypothetical protein